MDINSFTITRIERTWYVIGSVPLSMAGVLLQEISGYADEDDPYVIDGLASRALGINMVICRQSELGQAEALWRRARTMTGTMAGQGGHKE
jgi:hypothetical protein